MIYLDYQATTPLAPEARAAMLPWLGDRFGNPHSPHRMGREAAAAVEAARARIMRLLDPVGQGRLIFTSGATEAANLALQGAMRLAGKRRRIVSIATEHACVLDTVEWLGRNGFEAVILPVGRDGLVDLDRATAAIDGRTALVAAMLINNEIGVIQPVAELSRLARAAGALFFCDAVQGFGRVPVPVDDCDMIAISGHKIHGPKGVGALWLRGGVELAPIIHGGGQEAGIRSGTLAPALCAGFGTAAELAGERMSADAAHVEALWSRVRDALAGWELNGAESSRWRGNLNLRLAGLDAARLISEARNVAFSAGSACASGSGRPSHVLKALGLSDAEARSSIRLGFGRYTTPEEIDSATALIAEGARRQKALAA
jgi:cysteine desulfurase